MQITQDSVYSSSDIFSKKLTMEETSTPTIRYIGKTKSSTIVTKKARPSSHCTNENKKTDDVDDKSNYSK